MCKTRFDSQGMILNDFYKKKHFLKIVNRTQDPLPPAFMANSSEYAVRSLIKGILSGIDFLVFSEPMVLHE